MDAGGAKHDNPSPVLKANPISKVLYWWLKDLFILGLHKDLDKNDLYSPLPSDVSQKVGDEIERLWKDNLESSAKNNVPPSLRRVIIKMFIWDFMKSGLTTMMYACVFRLSQPLLLASLLQYFAPGSTTTKTMAYVYAISLVCATFLSTVIFNTANNANMCLGMRVRVACCSLVYRKVLRLSQTAAGQTTTGQVVNLMSNDVNRFDRAFLMLHFVWIMPIQTAIITYFAWQFVGVASLFGVGALFLQSIPIQGYFGKLTSKLRLKIATRTDERVKLMNEIISGIQVIKMYAWEKPFQKMVSIARMREIKMVRYASYLKSFSAAAAIFSERMTLFITLVVYVLLGNQISAEKVFSLAQFYNILQATMAIFYPQAVQLLAEASVSVTRLENFLALEEVQKKPVHNGSGNIEEKVGLKLTNASAKWTPDSITETLHNVSVNLGHGKLCAVIGPVGSGKSSLFQAILGELPLSGGTMSVSGDISYASQEPWLFLGTVRQNILFGQHFDAKRYKEVVRVCALQRDFELFPHGDKTIVGERGVSLSGGQRARINLARCVYRKADVYLLDDPLSAVDTHVSKHLQEECISGFLATKTRLLATHQLQHIKDADLILVLNNGTVEAQGTYNDLLENRVDFTTLLSKKEEEKEFAVPRRRLSTKVSVISTQSEYDEDEIEDDEPSENEELLTKGNVKASVYVKYFKAGGSFIVLATFFLSLLIGQSSSSGSDYWVTFWTNQEQLRNKHVECGRLKNVTGMAQDVLENIVNATEFNPAVYANLGFATVVRSIHMDNASDLAQDVGYGLSNDTDGETRLDWLYGEPEFNSTKDPAASSAGAESSFPFDETNNHTSDLTTTAVVSEANQVKDATVPDDDGTRRDPTSSGDTLGLGRAANTSELGGSGNDTRGMIRSVDSLDRDWSKYEDCDNLEPVMFSTDVSMYIYGVCITATVVLTFMRTVYFFRVCMNASINLHNTMFGSLLRGTMRFFDTNPSGRILNRFSKDMGTVDEVLPSFVLDAMQIFLVMSGILTMVAIVNYLLIIPMMIAVPFYYWISRVYLSTAQSIKRLEGISRSPVFSCVSASFNGLSTIRSAGASEMLRQEFDSHQDQHTAAWYLTVVSMLAFGIWLDFISNVFVGTVILSFLLLETETLGASVGLAISQSMILSGMLQYGIRQATEVVNNMTAVERVLEYTKLEKEKGIESEPGKKPPANWPYKGSVVFDHASLRYSSADLPVLKDLTFSIESSQKVGIVGRTGAGKSSLISALFRLAKLEGSIKIDDLDTQDVGLHDLRSRISIIPQEPVLFSASLRNNLDPFHAYRDDELWSALEEVKLKESVESLDFFVTAGGSNFSTGQRQLICLARAILRNNKILIMDEATANVDPQTDALIQATIRRKFKDCTVLTIAHRLNTIMDSDRVLVMDAGTMVEFNHPHILLQNREGHFYKMVQETGKSMVEELSKVAEEAFVRHAQKDSAATDDMCTPERPNPE